MQTLLARLLLIVLCGFFAFTAHPAFAARSFTSSNWAGYVADRGAYTGVGATWVVPEADEDDEQSGHATWVGIGGFGRDDLIQAGTMALTDSDDETVYMAWYEILPAPAMPLRVPVTAGDSVTVSITEEGRDEWLIVFTNNTTGKRAVKRLEYDSSKASADFIQEMMTVGDGLRVPIDDFEDVTFTDAWAERRGTRLNLLRAGVEPVVMTDRKKKRLVVPSPLSERRDSFTAARTDIAATFRSVVQDAKAARKVDNDDELFDIEGRKLPDGRFTGIKILKPAR